MSAEALTGIDAALADRLTAYLDSPVTASTSRALITDLLAALIPEPPTVVEREALSFALFCAEFSYAPPGWAEATWENEHSVRHPYEKKADAILAAGFRLSGPVTDREVEAAALVMWEKDAAISGWDTRLQDQHASTRTRYYHVARAALEAARTV